jgi:hypothetical protein
MKEFEYFDGASFKILETERNSVSQYPCRSMDQ